MKRCFTAGLALLLTLSLALPGRMVSLAEDLSTPSDMDTPVPTSTEAYYWEGDTQRFGELEALIPLAQALGQPVVLASAKMYELPGWTLEEARQLTLALDPAVFPEENRVVMLSETNPAGSSAENTVYLWVGFQLNGTEGDAGAEEDQDILEMELQVTPQDYDEQNPCTPTFALTAIPELTEGQAYGVELDGGEPQRLRENTYTPEASGSYRFVVLDEAGTVLALAPSGSTIYLLTGDIIILSGGASQLSGVQLVPDPGVFATSSCTVRVVTQSPLDGSAGLFVYVEEVTAGEETATLTLRADCDQPLDGAWLTTAPVFTLSCDAALPEGWTWAVRYDGGAPVTLAGDTFTAGEEGTYTLTFVVLDAAGQVAASTQDYALRLDTTAPLVQAVAGENLTLTVTASDAVSGIDGLSLDGGASWYPATEMDDGVWGLTFTASQAYTFAPGTIVARDGAGNQTAYEKEITLRSGQSRPGGGFSGGGSGSSTVATTHATSDTTAVVAYDGVELVVADEAMTSLVMGETELELWLRPDARLQAQLGEDYQPAFTATLSNWTQTDAAEPDTLVLSVAQEELAQTEESDAFTWDFNGTVYKKLAASGIDYLVLQVGEQVTALSTAGFAAGVRYAMYRAQGLSSEAFDYHVRMALTGETELSVTVGEDTWTLTDGEEGGEFYYYDVYTGTVEELAQAMEG